jgi:hypothetical protein
MPEAFNNDPTLISRIGCKIFYFFNYGLDALSPWCLVYISVEKYVSIAYPAKRFIFKRKKNQLIYLVVLILFNIIYHINILISFDFENNDNITNCYFINNEWQNIDSFMDLTNAVLAPFLLMFCFSILLIAAIFKSRNKIYLNNSKREAKRLRKDIKFAISLLIMNLLFLILILPVDIENFLPNFPNIYYILYYVSFISYAINFYIIFFTNSLFRKEFCQFIFFKNMHG